MPSRTIASRRIIIPVILLQVIPLLLFPVQAFSPTTQEWWLPALLVVLVVIADLQLIFGRSNALWTWHLLSFSQGFNIISRLMMVWSHATITVNRATVIDVTYVGLTALALFFSALLLWYFELPEVRMAMANQ